MPYWLSRRPQLVCFEVSRAVFTFLSILKKPRDFLWTEECQRSFEKLKQYLSSLPLLIKPKAGEPLYLYLSVLEMALSSVLVQEESKIQRPVYYTRKVLREVEVRYSKLEKTVYLLALSVRRLHPYFQAHPIVVLTDQPIRTVLQRSDRAGRVIKWAVELGEFDIAYIPRPSIKVQTLADFLVECTLPDNSEPEFQHAEEYKGPSWTLHVNGSFAAGAGGGGLILASPDGNVAEYALCFEFPITSNTAEYEALIARLKLIVELRVPGVTAFSDS